MSSRRRNSLDLYRDALLVLSMENKPIKRTPLMYSLNVSWKTFTPMIEDMLEKGLARKVSPEEALRREGAHYKARPDGRTKYLVEITKKGRLVIRALDDILRYITDMNPDIRPPQHILKRLFRGEDPRLELLEEYPRLEFNLPASSVDLPAKFVVSTYTARKPGLFCPGCGKHIASLRGLKIHIGRMHKENKAELWRQVELFLKTIPTLKAK